MFKKLFVIAAFSVVLLASAEVFAAEWAHGVFRYEDAPKLADITVERSSLSWRSSITSKPYWDEKQSLSNALDVISEAEWELVSVTQVGRTVTMYFKRPN